MNKTCDEGKTRWESSRKSLFVRTVWIRGYRHVILFDEDPAAKCLNSCKSRVGSSVSARKISGVLAEISNYQKEALERKLNLELRKTLSIQVIPSHSRSANVLITPRHNFLNSSRIASSLDSNYKLINENVCEKNDYISDLFNEYRLNSLSDRVLCWLDLAIQNEEKCRCTEQLKTDYREVLNQRAALNRSRSCDYKDNQILEEWSKKRRHFLKTDMGISSLRINNVPFPNGDVLHVTSYSEDSAILSKLPITRPRTEILKRQLHVFIPNIPKKNEDASSVSSKSSSFFA